MAQVERVVGTKPVEELGGRATVQIERWRPSRKFLAWVKAYKVSRLADSMRISRRTIHRWISAECAPSRDYTCAIMKLSQRFPRGIGPLDYEDIIGPVDDP